MRRTRRSATRSPSAMPTANRTDLHSLLEKFETLADATEVGATGTVRGLSGPNEDGIGAGGGDKDWPLRRSACKRRLAPRLHRASRVAHLLPKTSSTSATTARFPKDIAPCRQGSRNRLRNAVANTVDRDTRSSSCVSPPHGTSEPRERSGTGRNGAAPRTSSVVAAADVARRAYDLRVARGHLR